MRRFRDRRDAGARLGRSLSEHGGFENAIVLGLPRDGVPVAYEIARALEAALDILVVRKLCIPGFDEVGMGAIASGGIQVVDRHIMKELGVTGRQLRHVVERETAELARCEQRYRDDCTPVDVAGRTVIAVDAGLTTGSTMLAAVTALRVRGPARIVVAVPVGAPAALAAMRVHVDELHCLIEPDGMESVADYYDDFTQTTDDETRALLRARNEVDHGIHYPGDRSHRDASPRRSQ